MTFLNVCNKFGSQRSEIRQLDQRLSQKQA